MRVRLSFNPAMTLMDQVCEAPVIHGVMTRPEAEAYALRLFKTLQLPNPDTFGERYPHEVHLVSHIGWEQRQERLALPVTQRAHPLVSGYGLAGCHVL